MIISTKNAVLAIALLVASGSSGLRAEDRTVRVDMNYAKVLRLDRPVSKVIVGNAEVADVTVADATTVVLTGRSYGSTNLVLLDADGNAIADERIIVSISEGDTVRIYRQTDRTVLSCTPMCERNTPTSSTGG